MSKLKLYSFNVRGIRDSLKRKIIFRHLKSKYPDAVYLLQETHSSADCETKWRLEWSGDIFYCHGKTDSCGVAVLVSPSLDLNISVLYTDDDGRCLIIKVTCNDQHIYHICNIYAPTRDKVRDQQKFLKCTSETISKLDYVNLILGGDFNTVFNPQLDKQGGDMTRCTNDYTKELCAFMDVYDLIDAVRFEFPDQHIFTRIQRKPPVLSRIDHWLISSHLTNCLSKVKVYPGVKSDHSIISLHIGNMKSTRGKGFWKFNSFLLQDTEYVNEMNRLIESLKENTKEMNDKQLRWDYIKLEIRGFSLKHSFKKNKERKEFKIKLEKDLYELESKLQSDFNSVNVDHYIYIKEEIEKLEAIETKGAILRSKIRWAEAGEKNSKYFLNLEKRNAIDKHIQQLELADGQITTDPTVILQEQKLFYEKLYTKPNDDDCFTVPESMLSTIEKLSDEQRELCEGDLTMEECGKALRELQNGKSPGTDGLTNEFYKFFWQSIKYLVNDSLNYALTTGELSIDQKRGIITLIPKKGKKRILLKNWRPITLLNTDYKILTKSLALRLRQVLPFIINFDQTGFLQDRYIGENIRTIADLIDYTSLRNEPGIILLLDFEKAFDTVKWKYILESLKLFNFGPQFINWIQVIYCNSQSTVINNGHSAAFFPLERGIRQGCPLSPYLFIIAVEVMAHIIRKDNTIHGINIDNTEFKISQLADDTTVFLSDLHSVGRVLNVIRGFENTSGLKLNLDKTIAKCIGSIKHADCRGKFNLCWNDGPIHTLGITISNDPKVIVEENFTSRLRSIDKILTLWSTRGLSLKGRVTILKSLIIPKLLYPMSVLPVPANVVDIVDNMIVDFFWNQRKPKIKRDVIIQSIENGGMSVPHFASMVETNKILWIKRLTSPSEAKWKCIIGELIKPFSIQHFIENNLDNDTIDSIAIPFYRQIFELWACAKPKPISKLEIMEQIIWKNKYIKVAGGLKVKKTRTLNWPKLYHTGISKIKDVFSPQGVFLDLSKFCQDQNVPYNFILAHRIKKAIPSDWLTTIASSGQCPLNNTDVNVNLLLKFNDACVDVQKSTAKEIYKFLVLKKAVKPTALTKWHQIFNIDTSDWVNIYCLPYVATRETKLQTLQFKTIHRIVPCRKWLYTQQVIDSPNCNACGDPEDIVHYFIHCSGLDGFWNSLERWLFSCTDFNIKISEKHIIFGVYYDLKFFKSVNYIILLAKWFICKQKTNNCKIDFYSFLPVLKQHLNVEKYICTCNDKRNIFEKQWGEIYDCM